MLLGKKRNIVLQPLLTLVKPLINKLKNIFPDNIWAFLNSYLENRHFVVKVNNAETKICKIIPESHRPVFWGLLYIQYILSSHTYTATYADE